MLPNLSILNNIKRLSNIETRGRHAVKESREGVYGVYNVVTFCIRCKQHASFNIKVTISIGTFAKHVQLCFIVQNGLCENMIFKGNGHGAKTACITCIDVVLFLRLV